jgi:hypothetical protein
MAGSVYVHHRADTPQRWAWLAQTPPVPGCSLGSALCAISLGESVRLNAEFISQQLCTA